jgi:hypothetical protein
MSGALKVGCRFAFGAVLILGVACASQTHLLAQPPKSSSGSNPNTQGRGEQGRGEQGRGWGERGRGERDPFFEAMRDVFREFTPNRELMELLWHPEVRTEISLSDDKFREIVRLVSDGHSSVMELRETPNAPQLNRDQWKEKILAIQRPIDQQLMDMLRDPQVSNFDRLIGIYVQHRGFRSATNVAVAERIGLTGDAFESYRQAGKEFRYRLMEENRDKMGALIRDGDREKIAKLFEESEKKMEAHLAGLLTQSQQAALKKLEGEKFDIPRGPRGGDNLREEGLRDLRRNDGPGRSGPERGREKFVDCPK